VNGLEGVRARQLHLSQLVLEPRKALRKTVAEPLSFPDEGAALSRTSFPERPFPHLSHITTFLERLVPVQGRGRTELIELAKFSPSVDISRSARLRRLVIIDRSISAQTIWCSKYTDGRTLPEHQTPNSDHGRGPALGGCTGYETGKHEGLEMDSASECCVFAP
jgi:hypothetical protein